MHNNQDDAQTHGQYQNKHIIIDIMMNGIPFSPTMEHENVTDSPAANLRSHEYWGWVFGTSVQHVTLTPSFSPIVASTTTFSSTPPHRAKFEITRGDTELHVYARFGISSNENDC